MSIEGFRPLQARLNALGQTRDTMRLLGLDTVREAKIRVRRKTGTTGRSIRLEHVTDTTATITVGGAGAFLERGTRPHLIVPRKGKALRWPAKGTPVTLGGRARTGAAKKPGAFAFAKRVHHPGTKAQPFLVPAARAALGRLGITAIVERWNRSA